MDNIYLKMSPAMDATALAHLHDPAQPATATATPPEREMSRDVAHDLNNALTIIRGYTERLMLQRRQDVDLRSQLQIVLEHTQRAEDIIRSAVRSKHSAS